MRRPVHGEHHGDGHGDDRPVAIGYCLDAPSGSEEGRASRSAAGEVIMKAVRKDLTPRDIATRTAFENAIASVAATGGSTNAVLHLLAMAREAGVDLKIDDFQTISSRTPLLVDLKPAGNFVAVDVDKAGGWPVVAKRLVDGGYVDGSAMHGHRQNVRGRGCRGEGDSPGRK